MGAYFHEAGDEHFRSEDAPWKWRNYDTNTGNDMDTLQESLARLGEERWAEKEILIF